MNETALTEVIENIEEEIEEQESVEVREILEASSRRALGPLLIVPSLFMVSPLSGIPSLPSLCALTIIIVSGQLVRGENKMWLPSFLKALTLRSTKLQASLDKMKPWASRVEKLFKPRLQFLTKPRFIGLASIAVALTVPPLEFLPLAALGPGLILLLLAVGFTTHDGLAVILAAFTFLITTSGILYFAS